MDNKPTQDEVNVFLDAVRESGAINMFGASPYVQHRFEVSQQEAKQYLLTWMNTFAERHKKE